MHRSCSPLVLESYPRRSRRDPHVSPKLPNNCATIAPGAQARPKFVPCLAELSHTGPAGDQIRPEVADAQAAMHNGKLVSVHWVQAHLSGTAGSGRRLPRGLARHQRRGRRLGHRRRVRRHCKYLSLQHLQDRQEAGTATAASGTGTPLQTAGAGQQATGEMTDRHQIRPTLFDVGQLLPQFGRAWPKLGQSRHKLAEVGQMSAVLAKVGPEIAQFGQRDGRIRVESALPAHI